jgi:ABC-type branched-subunit amino acid transport system substrate-binding protein
MAVALVSLFREQDSIVSMPYLVSSKKWLASLPITYHPRFVMLYALLIILLLGCTRVEPVVKVGLVGPFDGRERAVGYDAIYSARLAVREINEAGGSNGQRVALVALDDGGRPDLAQAAARSLALDPDVVLVVGHWLPETTAAAAPIYAEAGLPFIPMGPPPFAPTDPHRLPASFRDAYAAITPFDEAAGPHAGPTYDAFQLIWQALAATPTTPAARTDLQNALNGLHYEGMTGNVYAPMMGAE